MSILSGGGRTYGFDLDLIKSPSPSSARSSSSSPSSTLSESSNSPLAISTKRARAPRKRPNQSYSEAVALLSTIYPSLFSKENLHKLSKHSKPFSSLSPSLAFSSLRLDLKPGSPNEASCIEYQEPSSPDSPDYDVESILDEEVGEGIDSIMGNLSVENSEPNCYSYVNPHLGSLMGFGYGLGRNNMHCALRGAHNGDWWRPTTVVAVGDIVPKFNASPPLEKKKKTKKKKKKVEELKDEPKLTAAATKKSETTSPTTTACSLDVEPKTGLGLKLNHENVLSAWSDREFPFSNESGTQESSVDIIARLAEIELFPENEGGGVREASVQRYREKRRNRLFSKKIRYQVRKVNADQRPRMKGRFVKRPDLLQEAIEEESQ